MRRPSTPDVARENEKLWQRSGDMSTSDDVVSDRSVGRTQKRRSLDGVVPVDEERIVPTSEVDESLRAPASGVRVRRRRR